MFIVASLLATAAYVLLSVWWSVHKSRQWPTVVGTVITSDETVDADGVSHHFRYEYSVGGKPFTSDTIKALSSVREELEFLRAHPVGANVKIYYLAKSPSRSVVVPGVSARYGAFTATLVVICVGAAIFTASIGLK